MFWPWQDGIHATLKMALSEKEKPGVKLSARKGEGRFAGLRTRLGKGLF
jgi:hypothetical protein